ncbi:hypothetical protein SDRG_04042 [Saprolegnia diclina VS20]|uniref:CCHC-type domain-containing protein n=1 Tax=Saprolegnia diclina (strain VS20) TaxID=1156394 RepID=T0S083_SAPDV|nr:hypothetical protein SDRG_04042 [Saprolegnia diclina VS20]EQC38323.1 hypothetical protein SDRG_04042 [Saprolegnia diclina VS20]|eukprot:XP_008607915.1 hypothetical protein SDRG_04042 [Saprolegnia diclina VS20]
MSSRTRRLSLSDVSDEDEYLVAQQSSSEEEEGECFDMSNPKAHRKRDLGTKVPRKQQSADASDSELTDEPLPNVAVARGKDRGNAIDLSDLSDDNDEPLPTKVATKPTIQLSKWASRFLQPRPVAPIIEEPELEPMNDFILSDFTTRFRGATDVADDESSDVDAVSDGEPDIDALRIGRPVASIEATKERPAKKAKLDDDKLIKPRRESRYFKKDLATKCFNCNEIGHMSRDCVNQMVMRPCFLCGYRDHQAGTCPAVLCYRCNQPGHESRNCSSRRQDLNYCRKCGRDHYTETCTVGNDDYKDVSCMVCFEPGHLHCVPFPRPTNRRIYCPKCAGAHFFEECDENYDSRREYSASYRQSSASSNNKRTSDVTCYECGEVGHIAAKCPLKQRSRHQRFVEAEASPPTPKRNQKRKRDSTSSSYITNSKNNGNRGANTDHNSMSYAKKYFARR